MDKPPTWQAARSTAPAIAAVLFVVARQPASSSSRSPAAIALGGFVLLFYIPLGYYTDLSLYRRRQARSSAPPSAARGTDVDVRMFTVGPVQENAYLRAPRRPRPRAVLVDPGEEADRAARARSTTLGVDARRDPADPHALRPRRRRRAGGAGDRRARLLPGDRGARPGRHHELRARGRASGRSSPTTPTRPSRAASGSSSPGFDIDVLFTPGHSPGHVTYAIADEQGTTHLLSRRRALPGLGRADRPARRRRPTLAGLDRDAARAFDDDAVVHPGHMGITTLGRERATNPFLAEPRRRVSEPPSRPRAARTTCCPSRRRARAGRGGRAAASSRPPGYRRIETPAFEAHRAVRARRRRVDRHRPEGDVHLRGRRRALADAAPRGHRPGRARLPRARDAQAPAAREALVPLELLPLRARRRPAATASSGRSARRRSAPTTRRSTPSRSSCCTRCSTSSGVRGLRLRLASPRHAGDPRAPTASELQAHLRAHEDQLSDEVRGRIDLNPLRAFDSDHPGTRAVMADRAAPARPARPPRTPSTSRRSARCSTPPAWPTRSTRPSCAASTTTRARSSSSPPTRSARRARSAAAGATTGWSSSSAGRRRPGIGWAAGVERMLLAAERPPAARAGRRPLRRLAGRPRADRLRARRRGAPRRAERPAWSSPGAR